MIRIIYPSELDDGRLLLEQLDGESVFSGIYKGDMADVQKEVDEGTAVYYDSNEKGQNAKSHLRLRKNAYPSIADQLDYIYHNSITKWKSDMIKPVKDKHPKP
jgi:hypothetical protein